MHLYVYCNGVLIATSLCFSQEEINGTISSCCKTCLEQQEDHFIIEYQIM